eukprot:COSAG03_NODE_25193_length_267_cov_0.619048_1_plen_52_part_01
MGRDGTPPTHERALYRDVEQGDQSVLALEQPHTGGRKGHTSTGSHPRVSWQP